MDPVTVGLIVAAVIVAGIIIGVFVYAVATQNADNADRARYNYEASIDRLSIVPNAVCRTGDCPVRIFWDASGLTDEQGVKVTIDYLSNGPAQTYYEAIFPNITEFSQNSGSLDIAPDRYPAGLYRVKAIPDQGRWIPNESKSMTRLLHIIGSDGVVPFNQEVTLSFEQEPRGAPLPPSRRATHTINTTVGGRPLNVDEEKSSIGMIMCKGAKLEGVKFNGIIVNRTILHDSPNGLDDQNFIDNVGDFKVGIVFGDPSSNTNSQIAFELSPGESGAFPNGLQLDNVVPVSIALALPSSISGWPNFVNMRVDIDFVVDC